jgi:flagellar biosynthesis anti-sigma factor FlgM
MKVTNTNVSPPGSAGTAGAQQTQRSSHVGGNTNGAASGSSSSSTDAVNLSGLAHSVRAQAVDSPERQNKVEQLTKAYASGSYTVDAHATAGAIVEDAIKR